MAFCPNCGSKIGDNAKFCTECGAKIEAPKPVTPAEPVQPVYAAPAAPQPVYEAPPAPPAQPVYEAPPAPPVQPVYEAPPAPPVQPVYEAPPAPPAQPVYEAPPAPPVQPVYEAPPAPPVQPVYEAPAEPVSPAPAQPAYKAPAQPAYKAAAQQPVTPPAPPSPAEPPKGGKAPKEKKPLNLNLNKKTLMFGGIGLAVVLVVVILIIALSGGGADADDPNLGLYNAVSCTSMGLDLGCEGEWIELKAKGKADLNLFGEEYSAKWSLDGDKFVLSQGGDDYEGSLKNGVLTIDFAGLLYTYEKEGKDAGSSDKPGQADKPAGKESEAGYWVLHHTEGAEALTPEDVEEFAQLGLNIYVVLNEDGSGVFCVDEPVNVKWGKGKVTAADGEFTYTYKDDVLSLDLYGTTYIYHRGEGKPPMTAAPETPEETPEATPDLPDEGTGPYEWWEGEWYGWWIVETGYGVYESWEGSYWDTYARIEAYDDDTGYLTLWDVDTSYAEPLAEMGLSFGSGVTEHGAMINEEGYFMDYEMEHADFVCDPGVMGFEIKDMICIDFRYYDPTDDDSYIDVYIFLRPWGMEWDDVAGVTGDNWPYDDMMPAYYYDWYLPLIEAGEDLPDSYADGKALLGGGANTPTASGDAIASGVWTDCTIDVVGAEHFIDGDGEDAIRVYYYFTNTSDESIGALDKLSIDVTQDGYDIFSTYSAWDEEAPEEGNDLLTVRPGVTILCCDEFSMKATGGNVVMKFYNWWDDSESFTVEFDPQNLPGRPAQQQIAPVSSPDWMSDLYDEATVDGEFYAYIDWAELVDGYDGDVIRVYFDYTNLTSESSSPFWGLSITAYQDGIELPISYMVDPVESDDAYYDEVSSGANAAFSICFDIRSESPIEIEICDFWGEPVVGAIFELN